MADINELITKYFRLLRFDDKIMEKSYLKDQKSIDKKLYLAFSLMTLCGCLLSGFYIGFFTQRSTVDFIIIGLQVFLASMGLLISRKAPSIGKIVILSALPLSFSRYVHIVGSSFNDQAPEKFYAFGNCVGIIQVALATNFRDIKHKIFLIIAVVIVDTVANANGFRTMINIFAVFFVSLFTIASFIYQEILIRQDYKEIYTSNQELQQFKSLLSNDFPIGVLVMSHDVSSVIYSNQFFKETFGVEDSLVRKSVFERFELEIDPANLGLKAAQKPFTLYNFVEAFANHPVIKHQDVIILPAVYKDINNEVISHYEIKIRSTTWNNKLAYGLTFNDVSEKQLVTALKLADQQKDRIIATLSHELRTPINGTLGLLEIIRGRISDELTQTYLNYCTSCNKLLLYLVNSILDLSQLNQANLKLNKSTFALDTFLEELKSLYLYQCEEKGIDLYIEKSEDVPSEIYTDKHRLIQVLINLVGNAIKFTFKGSVTLQINIDNEEENKLKFSIIDTGIGIKSEDQPKLFQRFGKIPQKGSNINIQGVGLGLAIVQELVIALNDHDVQEKVQIKSQYQKGSEFSFTIPFTKNYQSRFSLEFKSIIEDEDSMIPQEFQLKNKSYSPFSSPASRDELETPIFPQEINVKNESISQRFLKYEKSNFNGSSFRSRASIEDTLAVLLNRPPVKKESYQKRNNSMKVLIVDDNPFNILAASIVLEKMQCHIDKAFHGEDCLNILKKNSEQNKYYDLILMDIQMPIMDGPQASKIITDQIRAGQLKYVPIIALTAKKSTEAEKEYYGHCGIRAVLEKPLNGELLIRTIESLEELKETKVTNIDV